MYCHLWKNHVLYHIICVKKVKVCHYSLTKIKQKLNMMIVNGFSVGMVDLGHIHTCMWVMFLCPLFQCVSVVRLGCEQHNNQVCNYRPLMVWQIMKTLFIMWHQTTAQQWEVRIISDPFPPKNIIAPANIHTTKLNTCKTTFLLSSKSILFFFKQENESRKEPTWSGSLEMRIHTDLDVVEFLHPFPLKSLWSRAHICSKHFAFSWNNTE